MATSYLQQFAVEMKALGNRILYLDLAGGVLVYAGQAGTVTTVCVRDRGGRLIVNSRTVVDIAA